MKYLLMFSLLLFSASAKADFATGLIIGSAMSSDTNVTIAIPACIVSLTDYDNKKTMLVNLTVVRHVKQIRFKKHLFSSTVRTISEITFVDNHTTCVDENPETILKLSKQCKTEK